MVEYYENNPQILYNSVTIINNYYNESDNNKQKLSILLISIVVKILMDCFSRIGTEITINFYKSLKEYVLQESVKISDEFSEEIANSEKIAVYSSKDKKSDTVIYDIGEISVQKLHETDGWYQVLIIGDVYFAGFKDHGGEHWGRQRFLPSSYIFIECNNSYLPLI